jgi:hypothetical protein
MRECGELGRNIGGLFQKFFLVSAQEGRIKTM